MTQTKKDKIVNYHEKYSQYGELGEYLKNQYSDMVFKHYWDNNLPFQRFITYEYMDKNIHHDNGKITYHPFSFPKCWTINLFEPHGEDYFFIEWKDEYKRTPKKVKWVMSFEWISRWYKGSPLFLREIPFEITHLHKNRLRVKLNPEYTWKKVEPLEIKNQIGGQK